MAKHTSLSAYVSKRNGVPMGSSSSLKNMLQRSLGAATFDGFWQYWNPIWGYYLSTKIHKPLRSLLPLWLAIILTFAVSGALHDIAVTLIKLKPIFFFTPWFSAMGMMVVLAKVTRLRYGTFPWIVRAIANVSIIVACYGVVTYLMTFISY